MTLMIYVASGFIELSAKSKSSAKRFLLLHIIEVLQACGLGLLQFCHTILIFPVVRYLPWEGHVSKRQSQSVKEDEFAHNLKVNKSIIATVRRARSGRYETRGERRKCPNQGLLQKGRTRRI